MRYEFYYKTKNGKEHILYVYYGDEGERKSDIVGSSEKLIDFIKHNCLTCVDVYFDGFDSEKIIYILNEVSDVIEINYPPFGDEGPYQMFKRQIKKRGK